MSQQQQPKFVRDRQLPEILGNIPGLSLAFIRKDRLCNQVIPFHRVGRSCLYDPDEVLAAIRGQCVGGKSTAKRKAA